MREGDTIVANVSEGGEKTLRYTGDNVILDLSRSRRPVSIRASIDLIPPVPLLNGVCLEVFNASQRPALAARKNRRFGRASRNGFLPVTLINAFPGQIV